MWWDWSRVSLVRKAPLAPSLSKYSRQWIDTGHPPPPAASCLSACRPPVCTAGRFVGAAACYWLPGEGVRMFDRAVMYKFILDLSRLLAVIGARTQGLCGHNGRKGRTSASVCRSVQSHTRGTLDENCIQSRHGTFFPLKNTAALINHPHLPKNKILGLMERQLLMSLIYWWHLNGELSRGVQYKLSERDTDIDKLLNDLC